MQIDINLADYIETSCNDDSVLPIAQKAIPLISDRASLVLARYQGRTLNRNTITELETELNHKLMDIQSISNNTELSDMLYNEVIRKLCDIGFNTGKLVSDLIQQIVAIHMPKEDYPKLFKKEEFEQPSYPLHTWTDDLHDDVLKYAGEAMAKEMDRKILQEIQDMKNKQSTQ